LLPAVLPLLAAGASLPHAMQTISHAAHTPLGDLTLIADSRFSNLQDV
jgi:hypothetical protein